MIVTGLDLSLTSTGIVTVWDAGNIAHTTVTSKGAASATLPERRTRLLTIANRILHLVSDAEPDLIVIEQPAFSRVTGHMHDRSGLWWLVVDALSHLAPIVEVSPTTRAKYATGKGNASKDTVLLAVARRYPHVDITGNDEADALVLAAMGARHAGHPIDDMPLTHTTAMAKVPWPAPTEVPY